MAPRTKMMAVRGMLPDDTPASVHLALKGICDYERFKRELRLTLTFLEDYGGTKNRVRGAHLVEDQPHALGRHDEDDGAEGSDRDGDLSAMIASMQNAGLDNELILSAVQNYQSRGNRFQRRPTSGPPRVRTPPRDPKDAKRANCNQPGHVAQDC